MRSAVAFTIAAMIAGSLFLFAQDYQRCILYDKLSLYLVIFYLLWIHWSSIPYSQLFSKIRWLFPMVWVVSAIGFNIYIKWNPHESLVYLAENWGTPGMEKAAPLRHGIGSGLAWVLFKPAILGAIFWKTYALQRRYNTSSDNVVAKNVHICLWRPHNARSLIQSLCGIAVGSVSLYLDGALYGFRWGRPGYTQRQVDPRVLSRKFIVINTGVPVTDQIRRELGNIMGSPAGALRCRCVWVIRHILKIIDPDLAPRWYHMAPARYGIRVLKWRRSHG